MKWPIGWPLIVLSLFAREPYREQLLAGQTILCCMVRKYQSFHTATIICVMIYFTHQHNIILPQSIILHHIIVVCTIASEYLDIQYKWVIWTLMAWSTRWLGTISVFDSPLRSTIKFIMFRCISNGPWAINETGGLKWCWLLFVHELMWCLLPIQILYEVYYHNRNNQINESIV